MKEEFIIERKMQGKMNKKVGVYIRVITEVIGVVIFSVGIHAFIAYNHIVPGGVTGLATLCNYLFQIPIGLVTFLINFPLFLFGLKFLGKNTIFRTIITVAELSFMLDIGTMWIPVYHGEILFSSLYGGLCMGVGLSMILISGTTTGGGDLLGRMIQLKNPNISMGKILLTIDGIIILSSAFVFKEIKPAIFGILTMSVSSIVLDSISRVYAKIRYKHYMNNKMSLVSEK